jgi:5'-3' exonuclease
MDFQLLENNKKTIIEQFNMKKRLPPRNKETLITNTHKLTNTLLVDGNSLFKRGYFGAKGEYNKNGEHIGGIYQFITVLRKLLSEKIYHNVYVFWDGNFSGKLRYNIYPEYKANRGKDYINGTEPDDKVEVMERLMVQDYLNSLGIKQLQHEEIEADDFIGYYTITKDKPENITICTGDRDLCQLIDDENKVEVFLFDLKTTINEKNYNKFFNHHPKNLKLIKIICGDTSDNIKGIKRLGEDTLLKHIPELKNTPLNIENIQNFIINLQQERTTKKLKPLGVFENFINRITDSSFGKEIFELNEKIINLKTPLITQDGIVELEELKKDTIVTENINIKEVYNKLKRDGLDKVIGENSFVDYLLPFKKLNNRNKTLINN